MEPAALDNSDTPTPVQASAIESEARGVQDFAPSYSEESAKRFAAGASDPRVRDRRYKSRLAALVAKRTIFVNDYQSLPHPNAGKNPTTRI